MSTTTTAAPVADDDLDILAGAVSQDPGAVAGRYVFGAHVTACGWGERVGLATLAGKESKTFLVHQHGTQVQALPAQAVGAALAGGALPVGAIVGAFKRAGKLAELEAACKAAK